MADFFGGILDDLQGYVTDVDSFFDSVLGSGYGKTLSNASAEAIKSGYEKDEPNKTREIGIGSGGGNVTKGSALTSEDFASAEAQWLARMKRFASLDTGTTVKEGK